MVIRAWMRGCVSGCYGSLHCFWLWWLVVVGIGVVNPFICRIDSCNWFSELEKGVLVFFLLWPCLIELPLFNVVNTLISHGILFRLIRVNIVFQHLFLLDAMHKWVEMNSTLCRNYETWWWVYVRRGFAMIFFYLIFVWILKIRKTIWMILKNENDCLCWSCKPCIMSITSSHLTLVVWFYHSLVHLAHILLESYVEYKVDMVALEEDTGLTCSCYLSLSPTRVYPLHTKARCIRPMLPHVHLRPCNVHPIWFGN